MSEIKETLKKMVGNGYTMAKFGKLDNAKFFKTLLEHKGIKSRLEEKLGNALTVDTDPKIILRKHFLVYGMDTAAKNIVGKFV